MATRLLLTSHHVPQPSQHHSQETPSEALSLRWSKAAQAGWNHASLGVLMSRVFVKNAVAWVVAFLGTSKPQFPEIVFKLRHMPPICRGALSDFWPALHGTCTLPLQAAHPSHKASGFTGLHTWVLVTPKQNKAFFQPAGSLHLQPFGHGTDMPQGSGCGMHVDAVAMTFGRVEWRNLWIWQLQSLHK